MKQYKEMKGMLYITMYTQTNGLFYDQTYLMKKVGISHQRHGMNS